MVNHYNQGDIVYVDLDPTKGVETKKKRPCIIISNNNYNRLLNTVIIAPISSSPKYKNDKRYIASPMILEIPDNSKVQGVILLQHIRSIDPNVRIISKPIFRLSEDMLMNIKKVMSHFF